MSTNVPHLAWIDARNSRKMKLSNPVFADHTFIFGKGFVMDFRNYGRTLNMGLMHNLRIYENGGQL